MLNLSHGNMLVTQKDTYMQEAREVQKRFACESVVRNLLIHPSIKLRKLMVHKLYCVDMDFFSFTSGLRVLVSMLTAQFAHNLA